MDDVLFALDIVGVAFFSTGYNSAFSISTISTLPLITSPIQHISVYSYKKMSRLLAPEHDRVSVYLLGLCGPASAGKTTLAHQLAAIFKPHVTNILHGDDFCKDLKMIPVRNGYIDADGPDGVDFEGMLKTLNYVKMNDGKIPEEHKSWQYDLYPDQEARALRMVSEQTLDRWKKNVLQKLQGRRFSIVIIEGFLLYNVPAVRQALDCRLFVRLDHREAKHRRMARPLYGAEAKEGEFWKTEDYFEKMVWRNYVEQHADLFETGNVEGVIDSNVCTEREIVVQDGVNVDPEMTLDWAAGRLISSLEEYLSS